MSSPSATPPDRAFALLLDLERVAPCVPGAASSARPEPDGVVSGHGLGEARAHEVRVHGRASDHGAGRRGQRTAVIEGEGRATGGADTAKVRALMEVLPEGTGSRVRMTTDLDIKGRAAQMGAGRHRRRQSYAGQPGRDLHRGPPVGAPDGDRRDRCRSPAGRRHRADGIGDGSRAERLARRLGRRGEADAHSSRQRRGGRPDRRRRRPEGADDANPPT